MGDVEPNMNVFAPQKPTHPVQLDMMQSACAPIYEQMCCHVASNADMFRDMNGVVSRESIQIMCAPFFEQMISALQESMHCQHNLSQREMQSMKVNMTHWDDASTDADEVGAFASLLSTPPSEDSEPASDSEKSIMVCRHWKSKAKLVF